MLQLRIQSAMFLCAAVVCSSVFAGEPHWAFQPIRRPTPPAAPLEMTANAIDRFVVNRALAAGVAPAKQADRLQLIRRVSLDLIGLPPTTAEVEQFLRDDRPDAYERLVDRLLASPHYGERWARPWLDLCHYADTDGYLTDQERPVAWRYRAWLVDALNANLPFDQFTIQQLAGDLLPKATVKQRLATGFLRQTLSNREGGADPEEFRVKQVVDRTSMLGEVWLGLTVGCAQCHDHKYDSISQREFFQLYAFFNLADEINIDAPLPHEQAPYLAALPPYQKQRRAILEPVLEELEALQHRWEKKLLWARDNPGEDWYWDRQWELLGLVWGGHLGEGQLEGWEIVKLPPARRSRRQKDRLLDYFLPKATDFDKELAAKLKVAELRKQLDALKAKLPAITRAPTMMQTQNLRTTFVHLAGDFRDPGDPVSPATLESLPPIRSGKRNRLTLAQWLASPEHPLTARVAVNRMWQAFFGRGLVATAGDFGVRGAAPSHPDLLDWLADEFISSGWDVKRMQRLIVTSATYRRSSKNDAGAADDQNRFYARQSPLRLTAEQIRDAMLRSSGLWDARIGGPSVRPPQPESVTEQSYHNKWKASGGGDRYRRALYTWIQRTSPFAMHITFDAPNPNHVCTRRDRSNTPLQALTLLNDPVFFEAAETLGRQVAARAGDDRRRVAYAFQRVLSRRPSEKEIPVLLELLDEVRAAKNAASADASEKTVDPWAMVCSVLFNLHEFVTRN